MPGWLVRSLAGIACGLLLAIAVPAEPTRAQTNPFTGAPVAAPEAAPEAATDSPGLVTRAAREVAKFQAEMNRALSRQMRQIRDSGSAAALLIGMGLSFLYGVVHVAGPGHGKLVILSYFLGRDACIIRGLVLGAQIAVTHVIAAIVLVWLADQILRETLGAQPGDVAEVRLASYALIAAVGLHMLVQAIRHARSLLSGSTHGAEHLCHTGCALHETPGSEGGERRRQGLLSFAVGLVPCTGATLIMLYALANGIVIAGILMVCAIGLGMAVAMAVIGITAIAARSLVVRRGTASARGAWLGLLLQFMAGLAVTALGATLLLSATLG